MQNEDTTLIHTRFHFSLLLILFAHCLPPPQPFGLDWVKKSMEWVNVDFVWFGLSPDLYWSYLNYHMGDQDSDLYSCRFCNGILPRQTPGLTLLLWYHTVLYRCLAYLGPLSQMLCLLPT